MKSQKDLLLEALGLLGIKAGELSEEGTMSCRTSDGAELLVRLSEDPDSVLLGTLIGAVPMQEDAEAGLALLMANEPLGWFGRGAFGVAAEDGAVSYARFALTAGLTSQALAKEIRAYTEFINASRSMLERLPQFHPDEDDLLQPALLGMDEVVLSDIENSLEHLSALGEQNLETRVRAAEFEQVAAGSCRRLDLPFDGLDEEHAFYLRIEDRITCQIRYEAETDSVYFLSELGRLSGDVVQKAVPLIQDNFFLTATRGTFFSLSPVNLAVTLNFSLPLDSAKFYDTLERILAEFVAVSVDWSKKLEELVDGGDTTSELLFVSQFGQMV